MHVRGGILGDLSRSVQVASPVLRPHGLQHYLQRGNALGRRPVGDFPRLLRRCALPATGAVPFATVRHLDLS